VKQLTFQKNSVTTILAVFLLAVVIAGPGLVIAQEKSAEDTNMEILREKLKADKKLVVAANMTLTDAEAKAFWPIYEEYQKELQALNGRLEKAITSYAEAYNANTLTDEMAKKLTDDAIAIDEAEIQMRKTYATKLASALPGRKVARYLQIENKIRALVRYELAAEIPLVE
jgi:hypothetical protein